MEKITSVILFISSIFFLDSLVYGADELQFKVGDAVKSKDLYDFAMLLDLTGKPSVVREGLVKLVTTLVANNRAFKTYAISPAKSGGVIIDVMYPGAIGDIKIQLAVDKESQPRGIRIITHQLSPNPRWETLQFEDGNLDGRIDYGRVGHTEEDLTKEEEPAFAPYMRGMPHEPWWQFSFENAVNNCIGSLPMRRR